MMKICWRDISSQRNSWANLYAACEREGYRIETVSCPTKDVTLYSLNSVTGPVYFDEIRNADCITIAGGPHATARWRELVSIADYVVTGEGEYTLPRLLKSIESGEPVPPGVATSGTYTPVDHTVFLDGNPSFSTYKGYIEISRGCPYRCAYCQTPRIFGNTIRHRSIQSIVAHAKSFSQIRFLSPNALAYGTDGLHPNLDKVKRLLSAVSTSYPDKEIYLGTFPGEIRPEFVNEESVELVTGYCSNRSLHIGAQSGSESLLKRIHRGHTVQQVWHAVDCCSDTGITPVIDIIVGFPDETDDEMIETAELCREISRVGYVHAHRFIPLPGTPLEGGLSRDLIPEIHRVFGSLALSGRLTGSWNDPEIRFFSKIPK